MNFSAQTKAWILLVALIFGTSSGTVVTAYLGGAKVWVAVLLGLGVAGTNVYHALSERPQDKPNIPRPPADDKPTPGTAAGPV